MSETESDVALVAKRQFELLFGLVDFSNWQVYGGFEREPKTVANQEPVWVRRTVDHLRTATGTEQ